MFTWRPTANNFWLMKLTNTTTMPFKTFDGTFVEGHMQDIGYVAREMDGFVIRYYGSVSRSKHPVERIVFKTKEDAMECAEKHAKVLLVAKLLSR